MTREEIKARIFDKIADFVGEWSTEDNKEYLVYKLAYIEGLVDATYDIINGEHEENESEE